MAMHHQLMCKVAFCRRRTWLSCDRGCARVESSEHACRVHACNTVCLCLCVLWRAFKKYLDHTHLSTAGVHDKPTVPRTRSTPAFERVGTMASTAKVLAAAFLVLLAAADDTTNMVRHAMPPTLSRLYCRLLLQHTSQACVLTMLSVLTNTAKKL